MFKSLSNYYIHFFFLKMTRSKPTIGASKSMQKI